MRLEAKFPLGRLAATPGALEAMAASGQTAEFFFARHASGDYGKVSEEDQKLNDEALAHGDRILSGYRTLKGARLWVVTEAADDNGHRAATTILLPEEY
jgi:hypothetical protein